MKYLFLTILMSIFSVLAFSENILVTNSEDSGTGSLREAIDNSESGDTISLACGLLSISLESGSLIINNKNLTILGCHTVLSRKGDVFRILEISGNEEMTVVFKEFAFSNGKTETIDENGILSGEPGGGIYISNPEATLILEECDVFDNETGEGDQTGNGGNGAGIFINGGTLEMHSCNIYGNRTGNGFVNKKTNDGGNGGNGGGIAVENGTLYISNSTINNNNTGTGKKTTLNGSKGEGHGGFGGAIWLKESVANIENTTFYENSTGGSDSVFAGSGGAIYAGTNSETNIINCTFTRNSTGLTEIEITSSGGAIFNEQQSTMTMKNSIVSGNFLGNSTSEEATDIFGEVVSNGNNLLGKTEGCIGIENNENNDKAGTISEPLDANLLPLTNNGSLTKTCPLSPESPAINAGDPDNVPNTDQRGYPREDVVDIGAFEFGVSPIITSVLAISQDGNYFAGEQVIIAVVFDEPVWVIGSFEIFLETGTQDRRATYYAGSGNDTIKFLYNVMQDDVSSDLDVKSSLSFEICHSCLIQNFDLFYAVLVLPEPGSENSLSMNSNIVIGNPDAINSISKEQVNIYPNPVTNILNISIPNLKSNNKIEIFDYTGKLIINKNNYDNNNFVYDMSNYPSGIYFVKITENRNFKTYKFVIK